MTRTVRSAPSEYRITPIVARVVPDRRRSADTSCPCSRDRESPRPACAGRPAPGSSPCGGRCKYRSSRRAAVRRARSRKPSANSSTAAPNFRSSVARSPMRSVSLWRMCATPVMVVGPSANSATAASVCTVSLMAFMSTSMPRNGRPMTVTLLCVVADLAAHLRQAVDRMPRPLAGCCDDSPSTVTSSAGDGRCRPKVTRRRSVGLDVVLLTPIALTGRNAKRRRKSAGARCRAQCGLLDHTPNARITASVMSM